MRKIILYSAMSLDGYVARPDGSIDWLFSDQDYGYPEFLQRIDTTLMGNRTYQQILTFGDFPYADLTNYVFTRQSEVENNEYVHFVNSDLEAFGEELRQRPGKDIWLIGGGQINTVFLNAGLINEMILSVHPIILGTGISLFEGEPNTTNFTLEQTQPFYSGLVQLTYRSES